MAYTEFYMDATNGSNVNSGSDAGTSVYTSIHGNWNLATFTFTPTDNSNPATASPGATVGQFASVYVDGGTVASFLGRITTVTNATNGTIICSNTAKAGTLANQTGTATIKVGGCWKGPNAASPFPFTTSFPGNLQNTSGDAVRINAKNNATYACSSGQSWTTMTGVTLQGYTGSVNDGGKAIFESSSGNTTFTVSASSPIFFVDLIFSNTGNTGTGSVFSASVQGITIHRCVFHGARGSGCSIGSTAQLIECESYGNNLANSAVTAGFNATGSGAAVGYYNCISHDNTGSNTDGFYNNTTNTSGCTYQNCIADTNANNGFNIAGGSTASCILSNCDAYNNTNDGIKIASNWAMIKNCNLIKNGGKGLNMTAAASGFIQNCGYGAGTQANGAVDVTQSFNVSGAVTYGSNLTPWVDPANGDFRINLAAAHYAGRGAFTETAASYAGTIGYPDIGAAQALTGVGGTFSKASSRSFTG